MIRYRPDFPEKLKGVGFQTLEDDSSSIFALSKKLNLTYLNPAWFTFSKENHGEPIISERYPVGTNISAAMNEPFRDFYLNIYRNIF